MSPTNLPMSYARLLQQQATTAAEADRVLAGIAARFPPVIDCLLSLPYWTGPYTTNGPSVYLSWAHGAYITAGHTVAVHHQVFRDGHYLEAAILQRHLIELLVQLAYFSDKQEGAIRHFIPEVLTDPAADKPGSLAELPRNKAAHWKTMFEDLAPGYYATHYRVASTLAHGGVGGNLYRIDLRTLQSRVGVFFDPKHASALSNQIVALVLGYLRWFPEIFPAWDQATGGAVRDAADQAMAEVLQSQWDEFPPSREWMTMVEKLTRWKPQ